MNQDKLVIDLILATFALVLLFGLNRRFRTRRAKRNNEHSAVEKTKSDEPRTGETRPQR